MLLADVGVRSRLTLVARANVDGAGVDLGLGLDESNGGLLERGTGALRQGVVDTLVVGLEGRDRVVRLKLKIPADVPHTVRSMLENHDE